MAVLAAVDGFDQVIVYVAVPVGVAAAVALGAVAAWRRHRRSDR